MSFRGINGHTCLRATTIIMERTGGLANKGGEDLLVIRPLIKTFFRRITDDQCRLLVSGSPDIATTVHLGELILAIVSIVSNSFLKALGKTSEDLKLDLTCQGDLLPQGFFQAWGIQNLDEHGSLKSLLDFMQAEVQENVNLALSSASKTAQPAMAKHVNPATKLETMIDHAMEVIQMFPNKLETFFSTQLHEPARQCFADGNLTETAAQTLEGQIKKEFGNLITSLLDDMPNLEYERLQLQASEELKTFADDIVDYMIKKGDRGGSLDIMRKIKCFLTNWFAKMWMQRLVEELKKRHQRSTKLLRRGCAESLLESLKSQLEVSKGRSRPSESDDIFVLWFEKISRKKVRLFTKELSDLIYHYLTQTWEKMPVPESDVEMYADIQSKVWIFAVLLNWWQMNQANRLSERLSLLLIDLAHTPSSTGSATVNPGCGESMHAEESDSSLQEKKLKHYVRFLIEKILFHIYRDGNVPIPDKVHSVIDCIFEHVWVKFKDADFNVNYNTSIDLEKKIHKHLCKKLGSPGRLLSLINDEDPLVNACITSFFKEQLLTKNSDTTSKLFSSLDKVASKWRKRNKVYPMDDAMPS